MSTDAQSKEDASYPHHDKSLWKFIRESVRDAVSARLSVIEACNQWDSGANLFETALFVPVHA